MKQLWGFATLALLAAITACGGPMKSLPAVSPTTTNGEGLPA